MGGNGVVGGIFDVCALLGVGVGVGVGGGWVGGESESHLVYGAYIGSLPVLPTVMAVPFWTRKPL